MRKLYHVAHSMCSVLLLARMDGVACQAALENIKAASNHDNKKQATAKEKSRKGRMQIEDARQETPRIGEAGLDAKSR